MRNALVDALDLRGRHVLLTGAAGFLGQRVVPLLIAAGANVTALIRPSTNLPNGGGCRYIEADLANNFSVALGQAGSCDAVVHLAQAGGWRQFPRHSGLIAAVAVAATSRLAEHAAQTGAKTFVFASSGGIYGPSPVPIKETDPIRPSAELGFYLATKAAAENLLTYFEPHMAVHRLRYFFIYGPGQSEEFLIARLKGQIKRGEAISIADGRGPRLNPIYVDDAARITTSALALTKSITSNIAGLDDIALKEIADILGERLGQSPVIKPANQRPDDYVADTAVMVKRLGRPTISLRVGLAECAR